MENHFTFTSQVDPIVLTYLNDLIENADSITDDICQVIQAYLPENVTISISEIERVKETLYQKRFQTQTVEVIEQGPEEIQVNGAIKEDKDFKDKILEEHPYLNKSQISFLLSKYGKKQLASILVIKVSENENWFDELLPEYQQYCQQQERDKRREKEVKKALYEKYYSSMIDPTKTYRPLMIQGKEKMTRYRENKVVSNKGEKYVVENSTPEYDGGSRGRVKTKGKRGQGWI